MIQKGALYGTQVYQDGLKIRQTVFVQEQQVPMELEIDEIEKDCFYYTSYIEGQAVATCRVFPSERTALLQRMSVLKPFRHRHLGERLLRFVMKDMKKRGFRKMSLHAQLHAQGFYEKIGFSSEGDRFMDAGIEHTTMSQFL